MKVWFSSGKTDRENKRIGCPPMERSSIYVMELFYGIDYSLIESLWSRIRGEASGMDDSDGSGSLLDQVIYLNPGKATPRILCPVLGSSG